MEYGIGTDPLELGSAVAKFNLVELTDSDSVEGASGKDGKGEFIPLMDRTFNEKTEYTAVYEAKEDGAVGGGTINVGGAAALAITRIQINTFGTRSARLTIVAHKHGATAHMANARAVVLPAFNGFGPTDFLSVSGVETAQIESSSWTCEIGHVDKAPAGTFIAGRSQGARIDATLEATADEKPEPGADWKYDTKEIKQISEDFWSVSLRAHKVLAAP